MKLKVMFEGVIIVEVDANINVGEGNEEDDINSANFRNLVFSQIKNNDVVRIVGIDFPEGYEYSDGTGSKNGKID